MTNEPHDGNNRNRIQIDHLVTGELPEDQRRELFDWCNEDPIRWRQCALAFLESQTWHQGIVAWTDESISAVSIPVTATAAGPSRSQSKRVPGWLALSTLAASVAIAFIAGMLVRDPMLRGPLPSIEDARPDSVADTRLGPAATVAANSPMLEPTYVTVSVRTNLNPDVPGTLQIPVAVPDKDSLSDTGKKMPDYVRKQWEKNGYQVAQTQRYLNAKLPDGRDVVVPVNGLEVKFVGKPVY